MATTNRRNRPLLTIAAVASLALAGHALADGRGHDDDDDRGGRRHCSNTASVQYDACKSEVWDDFFTAKAICIQVPDRDERKTCFGEAWEQRSDTRRLCRQQRRARWDLCDLLGEGRYVPEFDPADFDDDFTDLTNPNPYYPLGIGDVWEYQAEDETNRVEVLDETKLIDGVTCVVLNDVVTKEEGGGEDTDDWYAQRRDGTVAYCGESVQDFEVFDGDDPQLPELIAIDGSFKAGRDGDLPGTIFLGAPVVGAAYRQEFSAGNAEDAAIVTSTTYAYGDDADLDRFVPRELAELLCADRDCVVTTELAPIEPDILDLKYYANGIGLFLEVKPGSGEINQLVGCSVDPRCAALPTP